jgi:predicted deacylase
MSVLSVVGMVAASSLTGAGAPQVRVPSGPAVQHDLRRGPGVTSVRRLSEFLPALAGTPGDTDVFLLDSGAPGATVLVVGGTHGNEIAGFMTAMLLVERVRVQQGRLVVIPHANNSAVSWVDPARGGLASFTLRTPSGERRFTCGSRLTKPDHQGAPDPAKYRHPASAESLDGVEARNLDRAYPGRPDGNLTERIAAAVMQVLRTEKVDVVFDLHESPPGSRLAWMMVAHPRSVELGAMAVLALEAADVPMNLERSSDTFRGLSHREWGDATPALAFLFETPNPGMGSKGREGDPVNDRQFPLALRVGANLAAIGAVIEASNGETPPSKALRMTDVPSMTQVVKAGVGAFLR